MERRKYIKRTGTAVIGLSFAGCLGDGGDGGSTVELSIADPWPESHHTNRHWVPGFMERVPKYADSDVTMEYHGGGQLGSSDEMLSIARNEVADIVQVPPAYFSGQLPLHNVEHLPGTFQDTGVASAAHWELLNGVLRDESKELGLRPTATMLEPPYQLHLVQGEEKINTLEGWEDRSIRSSGGLISKTIDSLGASPVEVAPEDLYSAGERGTIAGYLLAELGVATFDIQEILDYTTSNINTGSFSNPFFTSEDRFDSLPADVQDAILRAGKEMAVESGRGFDSETEDLRSDFEERGVEVYEFDDDEYGRMQDSMGAVHEQWVDDMKGKGLPGQEVLDAWMSSLEDARNRLG